jgi:transcriptional regulator with XRE-family HTH domain
MMKRPYADSALAAYVTKRTLQLRPKSQIEIAGETGFVNANVLSMIKSGTTKLPLDRVLALAIALDCDPKRLFLLAFQQQGYETEQTAIADIFGTVVTRNEVIWLEEIRDASGRSDPSLTSRSRAALRGIFLK